MFHKKITLMVSFITFFLGVCMNQVATDEGIAKATTKAPRVFNVLDYGAVSDDKTDNTGSFSSCLSAVIAAGGGRMYIPAGVYRGKINIPAIADSWIALEIVGESQPAPIFGTVGTFKLLNNNSIVKSLATSGAAVISASSVAGSFSSVHVVVKDLEIRTYDNPQIGGINLEWAQQCRIENVVIETGVYSVEASKPTHGTKGLVTPANNNAALTILRNVVVTGYFTGIEVNEHTDGDNIVLACNLNGLTFVQGYHASRFGRVGAFRCTHAINVVGVHGFSIQQLDIEHAGEGQTNSKNIWQASEYDIDDARNLGIGDVNYWVVLGNSGVSKVFTKNGGGSILSRRIGTPPSEK